MEWISTRFEVLYTIKLMHPYFEDGVCPYLKIEPDQRTQALLRNKHMVAKSYPGEIKIVAEIEAKGNDHRRARPEESSDEKLHFTFLLKFADYRFLKITKLDLSGLPKEVFYYANLAKSNKLSENKCTVADSLLLVDFEKDKVPQKVKLQDQDNAEIHAADLNSAAASFKYSFEGLESGFYKLTAIMGKADSKQTHLFYYNPLAKREPLLGVIHIHTSGQWEGKEQESKNNFTIAFEAFPA
jgi:hypothetical protein